MTSVLVRRSFIAFHLVLGLGLLAGSIQTLRHALAPENIHSHSHQHLAVIAAVEAIGAVLFLLPRVSRAGALVLVAVIGLGFIAHSLQGEWRPDLAIYAAGAWLVYAMGGGWPSRGSTGAA
ncbi:MAG TPA: hypothetical protein VF923_05875 [Gemmatimonadales bacterium]